MAARTITVPSSSGGGGPDTLTRLLVPLSNVPGAGNVPIVGPLIKGSEAAVSITESIGSFLAKLTDPHFWVRLGEGTVGIILITVGVSAMLHVPQGIKKASSTAKKVAKYVPK